MIGSMRRLIPFACVAVLGAAVLAQTSAPHATLLITGARILDVGTGAYLPASAVLIENGRITSITSITTRPPANLPDTTIRLKLDGQTLIPGLTDAHATAAPLNDLDADYFYLMGLAHGVTTYRVFNVRTAWGVAQRRRAETGDIVAPQLWTTGRGIDQAASPDRWLFDAPNAAAATTEVARQMASHVDWVAGYDHLPPEVYRAIAVAARGSAVRVSGQPGASSMTELAAAGVQSIDTLGCVVQPCRAAADEAWLAAAPKDLTDLNTRLVRDRVTLVPMLAAALVQAFPDEVAKDDSLALLPEARRAALVAELDKLVQADLKVARLAWTSRAAFVKRLVRRGGRVATGTGFDLHGYPLPGIGIHREMAALVRAGLPPVDAIRAATLNGAQMLGRVKDAGRIRSGLEANLFAVQGDPLKKVGDLARITTVIRAGEVFDPKDLLARAQRAMVSHPK